MTIQDRTPLPIPTPENMALWSRQMVEMQQMLLNPTHKLEPASPESRVEDDDDDDLFDNMPV